jgi:hypothetical protein
VSHTVSWAVVLVIPSLLFALGGILLWRWRPSLGSIMVAVGFSASLVSHLLSLILSIEYRAFASAPGDETFFVAHQLAMTVAIHYLGILGLWVASIGLLLHARTFIQASPNQRLERP